MAIGAIDSCVLLIAIRMRYSSKKFFRSWRDNPLGLASIMETIADGKLCLHATVSDQKFTYGFLMKRYSKTEEPNRDLDLLSSPESY
ncbi:MAG: hypothetical protein RMJ00_02135 [Nitrososphaerota archaeon]|nr:hypothetical protein [Candidatus Bathyarchaeota archaeon]MDW8061479.1 hypothetical protein [Nitrososphaerota archaeon]